MSGNEQDSAKLPKKGIIGESWPGKLRLLSIGLRLQQVRFHGPYAGSNLMKLRNTAEFRGIISCFWVAMAMASLWMPPLSSQLASMSICLPHRKCTGGVLRMNVADRRGGCPLLVVRASAMDAGHGAFNGGKR